MNSVSTTSIGQRIGFYANFSAVISFDEAFPKMSEDEFFKLCQRLDPMRLERGKYWKIRLKSQEVRQ